MNERFKNPNEGLSPEQEQAEYTEYWVSRYETQETSPEEKIDCEPGIERFEKLLIQFEEEHYLEGLHAITHLPKEGSIEYTLRNAAKEDLRPITGQLKFLKEGTNISLGRHDELRERYMKLSRAVGMVMSDDSIDHTR